MQFKGSFTIIGFIKLHIDKEREKEKKKKIKKQHIYTISQSLVTNFLSFLRNFIDL